MAPEYLMHGQLSVKADVFSYGVLVLELISGKKNSSFYMEPDVNSLLEWTWKLYNKGRSLEIMDPILASTGATDQVRMCIQIALLCVQGDPKQRPSMQRVVVLLSKRHGNLEEPMRPGYHGSSYRSSTPVWSSRSGSPSHAASTSASASASASTSNTHTATTSAQTRSSKLRSYEKRPIQG
eukprot:TRINITY_DN1996_c0_g2_i2.p1 TRINITY_DN1996_c0_g2~~TRINITY_DN1996_c0_g2_i2.p1  ORF type:complete len:181 (+),score=35.18 TRINITY_DN1996_c0_g2_i2:399-941(+)